MEAYSNYLQALDRSNHTVQSYIKAIKGFIRWFEDYYKMEFSVEKISGSSIRAYRSMLQDDLRRSPATVNHHLAALRSYCAYGMVTGKIQYNPCENIRSVREQQLSPRWLENRDQNRLNRELELMVNGAKTAALKIQAIRDRAMILMMLKTGIRVGELVMAVLDDIYLGERKGEITIQKGKGNKRRIIPLNNDVRTALRDWLSVRPRDTSSISLFLNKKGESITTNGVERRVTLLSRKTGVSITPHMLRHTFAKNALDHGADLIQLAALLGHENLNTTRRYLTPGKEDLEKVVDRL